MENTEKKRFPSVFYNWMSAFGSGLALLSFGIIVFLYLLDIWLKPGSPYLGLLTFAVMPVFLIGGLILIALGALLEQRRNRLGQTSSFTPDIHVDLQNRRHRAAALVFIAGTLILLVGTSLGTYQAYHVTESVEFCGTLCHTVMRPEFTAYQQSAHARVACVECHIGPGADWFVKSKLTGLYQVYATTMNIYPRPIPTPIQDLRPARETCEQCHWPEKFFGARKDVNHHFLSDEMNTPYPIAMLLKIGGGDERHGEIEGIHWHLASTNQIEYVAKDSTRQEIVWLRMRDEQGNEIIYNSTDSPLTDEDLREAEKRTMDCIDCHNRPSHHYLSPVRAVNRAMDLGRIDKDLPYIKREAVIALDTEYSDTETALREIERNLKDFYQENYPGENDNFRTEIDRSILAVQEIFRQNHFPEMGVNWRAYPDNIGHSEFVGCFRCHSDRLKNDRGESITKNCTACHIIIAQGGDPDTSSISPAGVPFRHPVDIGGAELDGDCTMCHGGGAELY